MRGREAMSDDSIPGEAEGSDSDGQANEDQAETEDWERAKSRPGDQADEDLEKTKHQEGDKWSREKDQWFRNERAAHMRRERRWSEVGPVLYQAREIPMLTRVWEEAKGVPDDQASEDRDETEDPDDQE
jgi:hypothetical protein